MATEPTSPKWADAPEPPRVVENGDHFGIWVNGAEHGVVWECADSCPGCLADENMLGDR